MSKELEQIKKDLHAIKRDFNIRIQSIEAGVERLEVVLKQVVL